MKYPKGTIVVPMYQAKRSLANANLSGGSYVTVWKGLYSEAFSQHPYARGFDILTVTKKADYKKVIAACDKAMSYESALKYLKNFSSQFSGTKNKDVIISNASEDSAAAVNALLKSGRKVGMITKGSRMGDFIVSYKDYKRVASKYILSATGVNGSKYTAKLITEAPEVYIIGRNAPAASGNIEVKGGNSYCFDAYALKWALRRRRMLRRLMQSWAQTLASTQRTKPLRQKFWKEHRSWYGAVVPGLTEFWKA